MRSSLAAVSILSLGVLACFGDDTQPNPVEFAPVEAEVISFDSNKFNQCRNGDGTVDCDWVTGAINKQNSSYSEDQYIPIKIVFDDVDAASNPHTAVFRIEAIKGGINAFDWAGTYDATVEEPLSNPCTSGATPDTGLTCPVGAPNQFAFPGFAGGDAAAGFFTGEAAGDKLMSAWGATITGVSQFQRVDGSGNVLPGNPYDCPDQSCFIRFTVTFTVPAGPPTDVVLAYGAHLASAGDWGDGLGAGSVSGSPYHNRIVQVDGDGSGAKELPVQSGALIPPEPDAAITIGNDGTNRVGDDHVVTGAVTVQPDAGEPFGPAPDGTQIDFNIESGPGSLSASSCTTSGGTGSCSVTLSSSSTGVTVVSASSDLTVNGVPISVTTDGVSPNSDNLQKTWVDAKIAINPPTALNPVGQEHTFTVTVMKDLGDGSGFVAAQGEAVTASQSGDLATVTLGGTCTGTGTTNASGQCTFTHTSNTEGTLTLTASSTLIVDGESITVTTDGTGNNSGSATKTWGSAWITIAADATNRVGQSHDFTVTVMRQVGSGSAEAVSGVTVTPTGETSFVTGGTCTGGGTTDASGQCTITVNSSTPDQATIGASATVPLNGSGTTVSVSTDGSSPNSGTATKTWVDAKIAINPPTALNPVGDPHTFTVTLEKDLGDGNGFVAASGETVTATQGGTLATVTLGGTCTGSGTTDASGQCTFTHTSNTAGTLILTASSTLSVDGVSITVSTDGTGNNSGSATKTWGSAWITIGSDATNEVGQSHDFTVTVMRQVGGGSNEAVSGVTVTPTGDTGFVTGGTCTNGGTTNASGQCTITVNSTTPGQATIGASAMVPLNGTGSEVSVSTDGNSPNSGTATKTWVDARIEIGTSDTNEVGQPHTFTVLVEENAGMGAGWVAASGETVTVTETGVGNLVAGGSCTSSSLDAPGDPQSGTGTTDSNGQCTADVNSNAAGQSTVSASSNVMVGGISLSRSTDGSSTSGQANSSAATKDWVTARISIAGTATNRVGEAHTFTVTVEENAGSGFVSASGETVSSFIVSNTTGIANNTLITGGTCTTGTTAADGTCTIVVNSSASGQVVMGASSTVQVGGLGVSTAINSTVSPFGTNAATGPATKTWVDAKISIAPDGTNPVGQAHTFTVTVQKDLGDGSGFVAAAGESVTASQTGGSVGTFVNNQCTTGAGGTCDIVVNSNAEGQMQVTASATLSVSGESISVSTNGTSPNSGPATKTWFEICSEGDRLTLVGFKVNAITGASSTPLDFDVIDGNGQNARFILATSPGSISVGDMFTVYPDGTTNPDFPETNFRSQNLRFRINDQDASGTVHLSCSDDPEIGDIHVITQGGISVTLEKTDLRSAPRNNSNND